MRYQAAAAHVSESDWTKQWRLLQTDIIPTQVYMVECQRITCRVIDGLIGKKKNYN